MQHHAVGVGTAAEQPYGFAFEADEIDEILGRLRAKSATKTRREAEAEKVEDPCRYEGLHTAIKRNREWYR